MTSATARSVNRASTADNIFQTVDNIFYVWRSLKTFMNQLEGRFTVDTLR